MCENPSKVIFFMSNEGCVELEIRALTESSLFFAIYLDNRDGVFNSILMSIKFVMLFGHAL
jgi:hypothetical protein